MSDPSRAPRRRARVLFRVGGIASRYDVYVPGESLAWPVVPGYLGSVTRYPDGTWVAVSRNGSRGQASTRREATRQAWWWRYA